MSVFALNGAFCGSPGRFCNVGQMFAETGLWFYRLAYLHAPDALKGLAQVLFPRYNPC